jgi:hypothetical protein
LIYVFIICACVCLQLHNCLYDYSQRSFPLQASNYSTFIQIMVLSGKQANTLISMDHHIHTFATTLGLLGGFKQPHLARIRLIGPLGLVCTHAESSNQCAQVKPAITKHSEAPFTRRENADIFTRFGLSFTRKHRFCHRKRSFLKTPAKVKISENAGYVLSCHRVETGF